MLFLLRALMVKFSMLARQIHQMPFPTDLKFSAMMVVMCGQGNMGWMFMCHVFKW
jgi:hypothetical protein